MRVALIGYGKMGQKIEQILLNQGHSISHKVTTQNRAQVNELSHTDVAIEFTRPDACLANIQSCLKQGIPMVVGTTGWLEHLPQVKSWVEQYEGSLVYASNFSIGVNILFAMNQALAKMMNAFPEYQIELLEEHHIHKLDAPSGTGISLAQGVLKEIPRKKNWTLDQNPPGDLLKIVAKRQGDTIGFHSLRYYSTVDEITLSHNAFSRDGFALGAVMAAGWIISKPGIYEFKECLKL